MNLLCSDPTCNEEAGVTLQRQIDVSPITFCLPHGYAREAELKQRLENYRLVSIVQMPPTELELAQARVAELERGDAGDDTQTDAGGGAVASELGEQLDTALHTLELQGQALAKARAELSERDQALQVMRRELERTRRELETSRGDLNNAVASLERLRAERVPGDGPPPATGPITPPPPTRPDPK